MEAELHPGTERVRAKRSLPARLDDVFAELLGEPAILSAALVGPNGLAIAGRTKIHLSTHLVAAIGTYLLDDATMIGSHLGETKSSGVIVQWSSHKFFVLRLSRTLSLVLALRPDADLASITPRVLEALSDLDPLLDSR